MRSASGQPPATAPLWTVALGVAILALGAFIGAYVEGRSMPVGVATPYAVGGMVSGAALSGAAIVAGARYSRRGGGGQAGRRGVGIGTIAGGAGAAMLLRSGTPGTQVAVLLALGTFFLSILGVIAFEQVKRRGRRGADQGG